MRAICFFISCLGILSLLFAGCSKETATTAEEIPLDSPVIKVAVFRDDRIFADGQPVSIVALRKSFRQLAEKKGYVWYFQEEPRMEASPETRLVMQAIKDTPLPFVFSVHPDFSDLIKLKDEPLKR